MSYRTALFEGLQNRLSGNVWPVITDARSATYLSMLAQLEFTQWLMPEEIQSRQMEQLAVVLSRAVTRIPYYKDRLPPAYASLSSGLSADQFQALPLLTRSDVQSSLNRLYTEDLPSAEHSPLSQVKTSGSTGMPITAYGTAITRMFWTVMNLRDHLWHRRDFTAKTAAIRPEFKPEQSPLVAETWGGAIDMLYRSGSSVAMNSSADIEIQARWLMAQQPAYLISLPSNLRELACYFRDNGWSLPGLREVRTYGEMCGAEVVDLLNQTWGVPCHDLYSTQEVGYIAIQCPEQGNYHIQSENLIVEILHEDGRACQPGETGRVVVTTLHNMAMPLIRYVIGDYAVAGEQCPCGRGLPVIHSILGRERNMLHLPDGGRHYPSFPAESWASIAPIRQLQLRQKTLGQIEAGLVMDRVMTAPEQESFIAVLRERLGYPFEISLCYQEKIERSRGGKYEDFISEL